MGIIEEIRNMQYEGKPDQEISTALQSKGYSSQQVHEAVSQTKIKEAVTGEASHAENSQMNPIQPLKSEMQPSLMSPVPEPKSQEQLPQNSYDYSQNYSSPQSYSQPPQQEYAQYPQEYYPSNPSSDAISEITEQIVSEKLHSLKKDIEKIIDLKNTVDSKIEYIDERLKRIEKIIDRLQLSILQKVGEYMTNVEDIKTELVETQKSFKSLLPESRRSSFQQKHEQGQESKQEVTKPSSDF